jgi:acyl-CoA synthetase (NDP forming)
VRESSVDIGEFPREFGRLFNPGAIAVVGASNFPGKWGFVMPMSIIGGGYRGCMFMVNPNEKRVMGLPSYPSLGSIGEEIDLVIVTVPARKVPGILEEAGEINVPNVLVVASDFSEVGGEGVELEREIAGIANRSRMTIIGPNTMGIYSATSSLCALGAPTFPRAGNVGFISQSGNLGVQLLNWGKRRGIGFSRFVGSGNEANTEITDYLEFLGKDPETRTVALYMEGVEDGRRFLEVASRITPLKPVVVLKGGRGEQGDRAVKSHSGALTGSAGLFEAMFRQAGVAVAETSEEMMDLVTGLHSLPPAPGEKLAVMTMGGGWGVVAADACDKEGLELASLPEQLVEELDRLLPQFWSRGNPVDIVGNLRRSNHFRVAKALVECADVDILIIMGAILGKGFFNDYVVSTFLRPFFYLALRGPGRLFRFLRSLRKGFIKSVSGKKEGGKKDGSVGLNPAEIWKWTDSAFFREIKVLMERNGKPVIAVSMSEMESITPPGVFGGGVFTVPTPERAVRVAAEIVRYARHTSGTSKTIQHGQGKIKGIMNDS